MSSSIVANDKIRVLHLIKSLGRGGAEVLLPESLKLHSKEQFEFHYVYFLPWKNQMVAALVDAGAKVTCMSATNNLLLLFKYGDVVRYVRDFDIHIIHCHLPWAGFLGRLLFRFSGAKVIYTEHNKQERYHWLTRLLNRLTFNWQSSVIAVSNDVEKSIRTNIDPRVTVAVISNGVNTEWFKKDTASGEALKASLGIPRDAIVVGIVSVFRFQKRLPEWLEIFGSLKVDNVFGLVIGDGPVKKEIIAKRQALNLQERVLMPGLQTDIRPWLSMTDIFMMTSVFEGMPVALLEAMSTSCAVCTTDAGGIKQIIVNEANGLVVPVDQWQELKELLTKLVEDPILRNNLAAAARQTVVNHFTMATMVASLEALYHSTSNKRS